MVFKFIAIISILLITGLAGYSYLEPYIYPYNDQVQYNSILDDPNLIIIEPTISEIQELSITDTFNNTTDDNYTNTFSDTDTLPTWKNTVRDKLENEDRSVKYQSIREQYYNASKIGISSTPECKPDLDRVSPITRPITYGTNGTNGWYVSTVSVQFSSIDDCSGIKQIITYPSGNKVKRGISYQILQNNQTLQLQSYLDKSYPKGTVRITYYAIDNMLNMEDKKTVDIRIDTQIPYLSILNQPNPVKTTEGNFNFTIYTADFHSGIDRIEILPCKSTALKCTPIIYNMTMDDLHSKEHVAYINYNQYYKKGIYSLEIRSFDYAGNYNINKLSIYVDTNIRKILGLE
jgi:hypothetical protein